MVEELARRVKEGFVPLMRGMQRWKCYYLLDGGPDVLITISIFDNGDEALASNTMAADWVRDRPERTKRPSGTHKREARRLMARVLNENSELRPSGLRPNYVP